MQRIFYANDTVVTGTDIARALVDYAGALAARGSSASVQIPVRHEDGSTGTAQLLIGPASQILIEEAAVDGGVEITDPALVASFRHEIALLAIPTAKPLPIGESPVTPLGDEYELRPEL